MKKHLYFSLIPESLIASMLSPEEFGAYYAVGSEKRSRGQAMFFEINPAFSSEYLPLGEIATRCVPHEDGTPRRSTYLSIYRVLEHLPLSQFGKLYLVTADGRVLGIEPQKWQDESVDSLHLYQEFCPMNPRVVSELNPRRFSRYITERRAGVWVPRIVFAELQLEDFAFKPETARADNLPYPNMDHMRDCLVNIKNDPAKQTKTVVRHRQDEVLYRTVKNGFFVGDQSDLLYYPMPTREKLEGEHYAWWRSALSSFGS